VARSLAEDAEVVEVHDLHVWTVTSGFPALAAHVLVSPGADCHAARRRLQHVLEERFHLHHVTLQVDHVAQREQPVTLRR
jgi:cobalt-zinc-cadmium efflux system protein